jgi:sortase A
MRIKTLASWLASLSFVAAGVALMILFFVDGGQTTATNKDDPAGFNVPKTGNAGDTQEVGGPEDKTLKLTIPKMSRIDDDTVPDAAGDDTETLDDNAAIHLEGTGFPWQDEANVYLAGHRLGYPGTDSLLAFYDQKKLDDGDKIYVTDSEGTEYTYRVFDEFVVKPTNLSVTEPVKGKNILTLQTCTLPNYTERIITRAELVDVA